MDAKAKTVLIVGDAGCGKSCLGIVYKNGQFPEVFVPKVMDPTIKEIELSASVNSTNVVLRIVDTASDAEIDYKSASAILLCYSIASPLSLENVLDEWVVKVTEPKVPVILVGCKLDLRNDLSTIRDLREKDEAPITAQEGLTVAQKVGAEQHVECSAKTGDGVRLVFDKAAQAMHRREHKG